VHYGGPVQTERGFILHNQPDAWQSTLRIDGSIGLTTSRDILEAIARNEGPEHALIALGYAGWGSGQIEHEITQNAWLSGPADIDLMFSTPVEQRWSRAAGLLGVDLTLLSREAGHA
jgi:putative transcriptional regulator